MLSHEVLDFVHKVWNKGVDITADVIKSLFLAGIGLIGWKIKLQLDKRHRIAMLSVETEFQKGLDAVAATQRIERLTKERDAWCNSMKEAAPTVHQMRSVWGRYKDWFVTNGLQNHPGNLNISSEGERGFQFITKETSMYSRAEELCKVISDTKL